MPYWHSGAIKKCPLNEVWCTVWFVLIFISERWDDSSFGTTTLMIEDMQMADLGVNYLSELIIISVMRHKVQGRKWSPCHWWCMCCYVSLCRGFGAAAALGPAETLVVHTGWCYGPNVNTNGLENHLVILQNKRRQSPWRSSRVVELGVIYVNI